MLLTLGVSALTLAALAGESGSIGMALVDKKSDPGLLGVASSPRSPGSVLATPSFFITFPDETNAPAVEIYVLKRAGKTSESQLIAAFWADGRIIWSKSPLSGGPPYRKGRYDSVKLDAVFDDWDRQGMFSKSLWAGLVVPKAAVTSIEINHRGRVVWLVSSHELLHPGSVSETQPGFYDVWSRIREDLRALVPPSGNVYKGKILRGGWEPRPGA